MYQRYPFLLVLRNRAFGDRPPAETRRLSALCVLFSPFTPMFFMGEEYGEEAPFLFFSDHIDPDIAEATRTGRRREFARLASHSPATTTANPRGIEILGHLHSRPIRPES